MRTRPTPSRTPTASTNSRVTNVSDVPADTKTVKVGDRITGSAVYDVDTHELTVNARSSDEAAPPTLTAPGSGDLDANGTLVVEDVEGVPAAIAVASPAAYGGKASLPVQLQGKAYPAIPVVAFAGRDDEAVAGRQLTSTGPARPARSRPTRGSSSPARAWSSPARTRRGRRSPRRRSAPTRPSRSS